MRTWLLVSMLFACGGSREVSKVKYTHTDCAPSCGIEPQPELQYAPPDDERVIPEAVVGEPEPTCRLAAEQIVSVELGNYAEPETRAPVVEAEERRCLAARLTRDDRECIIDADDRSTLAYCAPALFPDVRTAIVSDRQCAVAGAQMKQRLDAQLQSMRVPDTEIYERQLAAAIESCRRDRWTPAMLQCATAYVPIYAGYCQQMRPAIMWRRLEARLARVHADAK